MNDNPYQPQYEHYITGAALGNHTIVVPPHISECFPEILADQQNLLNYFIDHVQEEVGYDLLTNYCFNRLSHDNWNNSDFFNEVYRLLAYYAGLHLLKRLDKQDAILKATVDIVNSLKRLYINSVDLPGVNDGGYLSPEELDFWSVKDDEINGLSRYYLDNRHKQC